METIKKAVSERLGGGRPSPLRAFTAATATGATVGVVVYRLLRR
jgi:hypothetical protein